MKSVILAGGYGSRLSEETTVRPKPMVEIGGKPILWHIMKIYEAHGITDFIICCGYKGDMIKEYFADYFLHASDLRFDLKNNKMEVLNCHAEPWTVTLVDTGLETATGGRLRQVASYLGDEAFCFTYGDGVSDVHIRDVIAFHREQGVLVTVTAVQPPARFGALVFDESGTRVRRFKEKQSGSESWVNGGFFVIEPAAIEYITEDAQMWEFAPLERLAQEGQLAAFRHDGFWRCMDHLSDKVQLEGMWDSGAPPWKVWG
jgi:glucose-1-phosphate cytidylyltransferase